ncbi:MAG: LPS translocon maturation chaperone LptM [Wenzhouxiangella sp.]
MRAILPVVITLLLLGGCGLKDDLYLPDPSDQAADQANQQERPRERDDEEDT